MKPISIRLSFVYTFIPAVLLYITTHLYIPYITDSTGIPPIIAWYTGALFFVFLPMFIASIFLFRNETREGVTLTLTERFRLNKPGRKVIVWSFAGVVLIFILTYLFMQIGTFISPSFSAQPSFMHLSPLKKGEIWMLAAWLPMFAFNILGEAFYWRGYLFPRQELTSGNLTWILHGFLWWLFHFSFGINLMFTLFPIIFITSWLVQKTKSTWTDIIIHTAVNGTGFILVAFGIV